MWEENKSHMLMALSLCLVCGLQITIYLSLFVDNQLKRALVD
jgi:hypothetical protein